MTTTNENQLRRKLNKRGYSLHLSRKPLGADNLGGYMIASIKDNIVAAGSRFELTPEDVQNFINELTD
jgi:hypothetical protein